MSTQATGTSIQHSIVVDAPQARAFAVFTEQFDRIKPHDHNLLGDEAIAETVFEARPGGRIYDRGVNGSECAWARVLAVDPPDRVVFSWDISASWTLEPDPDKASEVEVRFIAEGPGPDARGARAPSPPAARRGLGGNARRRGRRRRLAAVPGPVRAAARLSGFANPV